MKCNIILFILLLSCFLIMFTRCIQDTNKENLCIKCGSTATTILSGPSDITQKNGISISDCKQITSNIYSAQVCDSCVVLVAEIKPDSKYNFLEG